ncbi:3'-5' exonuclease [Kineosporia sp. R_H_3]|uniref:3'-5' exonuclease n=1 Tax=Kineosporia sp. R_H_3 TaxID=1961848 RepID=UPI000B4B7336|nr:3'-5' exonuclease [Kineosporia sp. R_H_3]
MTTSSDATFDAQTVVRTLSKQLAEDGGRVVLLAGDGEPSLVVLHPKIGLVAIDIDESQAKVGDPAPFLRLNEKVHSLRQTLRLDAATPIGRVVLNPQHQLREPQVGLGGRTSISPRQLVDPTWLTTLRAQPLGESLAASIAELLEPTFTFETTFRRGARDEGAGERERLRVTLDTVQASIAQREDIDVARVQGPPGSGKTLVLAARGRWLSAHHPDWRIKFLCFNNALVSYLKSLVAGYPNVEVTTMWPFAAEYGVRFSFTDEAANRRNMAQARLSDRQPIADAVLLDEVQDFNASWLAIIYQALTPNRGGMVMAGDNAQSLYGDHDLPEIINGRGVEELHLHRPYRTTRNILGAVSGISEEFTVASMDQAPDGEPVDLIWADSPAEQAAVVAWEVSMMLASGDREPGDIAVIIPRYKGLVGHIRSAFDAVEIPYAAVVSKDDKKAFDRTTNTVKIITPHSAKGHEFPVVFFFGLDTLPPLDPEDDDSLRIARASFVGATRAKDQLLITYTRDNSYLKILSTDKAHVRRWLWPDHYEGVPDRG